jgi:lysophospholipase L1-like esterase
MNSQLVIVMAVLVTIGVWWLWPEPTITNYPARGTDLVAFGDSLIEGVGANPGKDLVSQLSVAVGMPIVNLGVSGDTTAAGLARISQLDTYDPRVVVLLLGGNDALRNVPLAETRANLSQIITNIQSRGAVVLLLGVRGGLLGSGNYDEMYQSLAKEHQTAFVPDVLRGVFGRSNLMADAIHPNDDGYTKMAERILPVLESVVE